MPIRSIPPGRLPKRTQAEIGLTEDEAQGQRARFGTNDIIVAPPSNWLSTLSDTLRDPMIWFLVVVSVLFVVIGDYTEAAVLAAAIVPLAGMDLYLHRRTQASTQGLASRLASQASVIRDGNVKRMSAREIVPGDLVELASGEFVPADGLFVAGNDLQVDESSLTGEAYPVVKQPADLASETTSSFDLSHWAFAGTRLLTGKARVRIVSTGSDTLYGEIVKSALIGSRANTPLQIAVRKLVGVMPLAAVLLCIGLATIRLLQGHGLVDAFLSALILAIAALPEEFPVVFAFFLGVGVYRLARRQALVRRSVAVENIGRVTSICSDKTGTLTEGRVILSHSIPCSGVSPERLVHWAAAASRHDSGDPLDSALTAAAPETIAIERLASFPFTEDRRRETAIIRQGDGVRMAVVKGAPETVFQLCDLDVPSAEIWRAQVSTYASTGHKVIAAATRLLAEAERADSEPENGYTLAGLLALEDPIREGVREAVATCREAGIKVMMVTGDHPNTAEAVARDIGLGAGRPNVVLADAIDFAESGESRGTLAGIDAIARATPSQKVALVSALKRYGETVAVTGDGVNDVPALQIADVGIAMGERGTQSAREVAAMVLLDDNFRTIVRAIAEGRQLFLNLQLAFAYLLLVHIPLVVSAAAVPLLGGPLLYLPIHIIWLELIIHPTALLVFQEMPSTARLLPTKRGAASRFFDMPTWILIGLSGLAQAAIISIGFELALEPTNDVAHARSISLGILIGSSAAITGVLSGLRGWPAKLIVAGSLASFVLLVQIPLFAELVHLSPLHPADWLIVAAAMLAVVLLTLAVKILIGRDRHTNQSASR